MASTGLKQGPHSLSKIDDYVKKGKSIGVYVLGLVDPDDGKFIVRYVGRSDHHDQGLNARLHEHDGTKKDCTHFKFDYFTTPKEAFERECQVFHDFDPKHNDAHPPRPSGEKYKCPMSDKCFEGDQED